MGAFLDKPIVEKATHHGEGNGLRFALSSMQGWRVDMEDAHLAEASIDSGNVSIFAVFDGHGGQTVSRASAEQFVHAIQKTDAYKADAKSAKSLELGLKHGFYEMDKYLLQQFPKLKSGEDRSGSTAIASIVTPTSVILANVGDSRAVFCRNGDVFFATKDHKPSNPEEVERIKNANGFVQMGRVCGNLAVSRALGDFEYKDVTSLGPEKQKISSEADTTVIERTDGDEFLILACDGIWDVMSNAQAYTFVKHYLESPKHYSVDKICELLLDWCLKAGSKDNMSVIIVLFPHAPSPKGSVPANETPEHEAARVLQEAEELDRKLKACPSVGGAFAPPPTQPMSFAAAHAATSVPMEGSSSDEEEDGGAPDANRCGTPESQD